MSVLVGKKAPDFKANAVVGGKIQSGFTLSQFIGKKYVIPSTGKPNNTQK